MPNQILIFCIAFVAPFILIRTSLRIISGPINKISHQTITGYKFHHIHYGLIVAFIGCLALLFTLKTSYAISIIAFGLGMCADEFITTLLIPENEPEDTILYESTFKKTLLMLLGLLIIIGLFSYFLMPKH